MEISVCIVSWNVRELLRRCLDSVLAELRGLEGEAAVADNASSDGSSEMVRRDYPGIRLVCGGQNRGLAAAANPLLRSATGRYLLLLNPDTVLNPGTLRGMVEFLDRHPEAGGAGCRQLNPDGSLQPSVRAFPTRLTGLEQFTVLGRMGILGCERRRYLQKDFDYDRPSRVEQPMGAALFLRREAAARAGWLDEGYFLYFEEVDLCWRLARAGYPMYYNPSVSIVHHGGASAAQAGPVQSAWLIRSFLRFIRVRYGVEALRRYRRWFIPLLKARLALDIGLLKASGTLRGRGPRAEKTRAKLAWKREFRDMHLAKVLDEEKISPAQPR